MWVLHGKCYLILESLVLSCLSGFVRSVDSDGQIPGLVVRFEVDAERVRVVSGVAGAVTLERAGRLKV
jgi:hypothetical protein